MLKNKFPINSIVYYIDSEYLDSDYEVKLGIIVEIKQQKKREAQNIVYGINEISLIYPGDFSVDIEEQYIFNTRNEADRVLKEKFGEKMKPSKEKNLYEILENKFYVGSRIYYLDKDYDYEIRTGKICSIGIDLDEQERKEILSYTIEDGTSDFICTITEEHIFNTESEAVQAKKAILLGEARKS